MIDADLIDSLPKVTRDTIRQAIGDLASSGVLEAQRQRLLARVAEGAEDEKTGEIVQKILLYRRQSHELLALQQLGESFNVEKYDEED